MEYWFSHIPSLHPPRPQRFDVGTCWLTSTTLTSLGAAIPVMAHASLRQAPSVEHLRDALLAHEGALWTASSSFGTSSLAATVSGRQARGHAPFARPLRPGPRARGALAHPDRPLAGETAAALQAAPDEVTSAIAMHIVTLPSGPWGGAERNASKFPCGDSSGGERSESSAQGPRHAPLGPDMAFDELQARPGSVERQVDTVLQSQLEKASSVLQVDERRADEYKCDEIAFDRRFEVVERQLQLD